MGLMAKMLKPEEQHPLQNVWVSVLVRTALGCKYQKHDLRGLTKEALFSSHNEKHSSNSSLRLIFHIVTTLHDPGFSSFPSLQSEHMSFLLMLKRWLLDPQPSHPYSRQEKGEEGRAGHAAC